MSVEEHHFESKADTGTYRQEAQTICQNGYIVIKNRPCKVLDAIPIKTGKKRLAKCYFDSLDIFTEKRLQYIVPSYLYCDVPHVNRSDYQLIDVSEDGFVSLLSENGGTKDDLSLPTDCPLTLIKDRLAEGKNLVVTVICAMGEERICKVQMKELGPK